MRGPGAGQRRGGARPGRRSRGPGERAGRGSRGDTAQRLLQCLDGVAVRRHDQVIGVVGAAVRAQGAEHHIGVVQEVLADRHLGAVQLGRADLLPGRVIRRAVWLAAPEDQQVGDDPGARRALVRAAGQPHRAGQVRQRRDLAARRGVAAVHGVPGGDHRDQGAGPGQVQGLDDEVVVDAVAALVVPPVVQGGLAEGHVPDRQVERGLAAPRVREGLVDDLRVRVERRRDLRGDRLEFHPGDAGPVRGERDEVPAAAARFEDPPGGEPELPDAGPDRLDQAGVGVVRVQRVPRRRRDLRPGSAGRTAPPAPRRTPRGAHRRSPGPLPTPTSGPVPPAPAAMPGGHPAG